MKNLSSREKKALVLTIIFLLCYRIVNQIYLFEYRYNEESGKFRCFVIEKKKETEEKVSYLVTYDKQTFLLNLFFQEKEEKETLTHFQYGDILAFRGKINKLEKRGNPYEFDYKKYLNASGIVSTISAYGNVEWIEKSNGNPVYQLVYTLKGKMSEKIDEKLPKKEAGLYKGMIYGDGQDLEEDIKEDFSKNGMNHMLAVSGTHFMYLILTLDMIFGKLSKKKTSYLYTIIILCYLILSGMSLSAIRASIMSIVCLYKKGMTKKQKYGILAISYLVLIMYNPYSIFHVSGIFSYLATIRYFNVSKYHYEFF